MPNTRRRTRNAPEIRREQIIDEAIRIVGQCGYFGFGIEELAKRCGLSKAGLLYHFESKDQLLDAVLLELERREIQVMAPLVARTDARPSAIVELLRTMVARGTAEPELGRFYTIMSSESLNPAHPAYASFRLRQTKILDLFTRLVKPYVAEPHDTARQLLAMMQGLGLQWHRESQSFDAVEAWVRAITTLVPRLAPPRRRQNIAPQPIQRVLRRRHNPSTPRKKPR